MSTQISTVTLTNFQKVSYAKIVPTGSLIIFAGKNGAGKTTTTEAIEAVLCGHDSKVIRRPIKDGAHKGGIEIELTDGSTGVRSYTGSGGSSLKFLDKDGKKTGQADLNKRIGSLGLDGRRFMDMDDKARLKELLTVVDLPFNLAELDTERKAIFDERTNASRDVKRLEAQASGFVAFPVDTPTEEVNLKELLTDHHTATQQNAAVREAHASVEVSQQRVDDLRAQLERAEEELARRIDLASGAPELIDTAAIQQRIDTAEATNSRAREFKAAQAVNTELATARDTADQLTADLAEIDQRKADGLKAAADQMPVEGLLFDEEGVTYQGVPFSRAAGAEKGIVSIAMIIATDPDIRVIVFRDGNVFDMESLAIVQAMAEENNFQIFIEIVKDERGDEEFYFEDGELAA